jgi:site-specific DNA-cytosine methylase
MMLENVEEFKTWGPLLVGEMRPDPERAGETFRAFIDMLSTGVRADHPALEECCEFLQLSPESAQAQQMVAGLGYDVDYRELRACDYGAPTIRKRFFMVMRRDGQPIAWPDISHGDPKSPAVQAGALAPWRTAAECIDWSICAPSIFGRKKSLAENTHRPWHPAICHRQPDAVHREVQSHHHERKIRLFQGAGIGRAITDYYQNPWLCHRGAAPHEISRRRHRGTGDRTGTDDYRWYVKAPGWQRACTGDGRSSADAVPGW